MNPPAVMLAVLYGGFALWQLGTTARRFRFAGVARYDVVFGQPPRGDASVYHYVRHENHTCHLARLSVFQRGVWSAQFV